MADLAQAAKALADRTLEYVAPPPRHRVNPMLDADREMQRLAWDVLEAIRTTTPAQPERGGGEPQASAPKAPDAAEVVVPDHAPLEVPDIGNYYGGLWIKREGGVDYWSIEDHSGHYWAVVPEPVASAIRAMISTAEQEGRA